MAIITLLTDFGLKDPYAGVMKGIILAMNPSVAVVDITHEVEPQDVVEAAFLVEEYVPFFPAGTVHVCVVDPGVGSDRRALVVSSADQFFVGPDNGIFSLVMGQGFEAFAIKNPACTLKDISSTFHGRDVFAPAAAHLSLGLSPLRLGPRVTDPVLLPNLQPVIEGDTLHGRVIRFDHFGNAITNISRKGVDAFASGRVYVVEAGGKLFTALSRSYFEHDFTCVVGSSGYLEFGFFKGSFQRKTGVKKGDAVVMRLR